MLPDTPAIPLLLAADWSTVFGIVVLLFISLLRAMAGDGGAKKKQAERNARRQPQPQPPGGANQPAAGQRELRSEVDDFLRRVQQREQAQQRSDPEPQQRSQPPRIEVLVQENPERPALRDEPPRAAEREPGSVAGEHVGHLKESMLAESAAHLGEQIAMADEKVAARLQATFGRGIGTLARSEAEAPTPVAPDRPNVAAGDIIAMLSNPQGARNAIVLSEILRRPTDRW